ncbi:UDP-2,3-diacylglucosamine diphosphatase LpxI [Candidatus Sumerlaeota bacterium]|nr:UDP-2,3-diacylglucosamine diphosphatase LpxI [Candidatus Sumerlaeota bacterium]
MFKKIRPDRLGVIAGQGNFPLLIAEGARHRGVEVIGFGVRGITSEKIEEICARVHWMGLGQLQRAIDTFHEENLKYAVMAGRFPPTALFKLHKMDRRALRVLTSLGSKQADSLLGRVVQEFASEGIEYIDSSYYLSDMLPKKGVLTNHREPTDQERADVAFGHRIAKEIAGLDIGQTIVVKSQLIVAVEAMEGTDQTILRAGELAGPGTVIIKVSKPRQDRRFDIPVVGITTVKNLVKAQASLLAMSAGETLFFDQEEAIALAEENNICLMAI